MRKDILLEHAAPTIIHRNLDLLYDHHHRRHIVKVVPEVALAEQVVEAVVLLVHNQHFIDLLDHRLLDAVIHNLQVLLLELEHLVHVVELVDGTIEVEAVDLVEGGRVFELEVVVAAKDVAFGGALVLWEWLGGAADWSGSWRVVSVMFFEEVGRKSLTSETSRKC